MRKGGRNVKMPKDVHRTAGRMKQRSERPHLEVIKVVNGIPIFLSVFLSFSFCFYSMCDNLKHTHKRTRRKIPTGGQIVRRCRSLPPPSPLRNFLGAGQNQRASHQNIQRRSFVWLLFFLFFFFFTTRVGIYLQSSQSVNFYCNFLAI